MIGLSKVLFGGDPRAYRQEIGGAWGRQAKIQSGLAFGMVAGTRVATAIGWRPVEAITAGDLVLTFDRGLQPVKSVTRGLLWAADEVCPKALWPLQVPKGALGNDEELIALPEQPLLIESDTADLLFDDPFALVNAADLEGLRGISRVPPIGNVEVMVLQFERDEVVFGAEGALAYCPAHRALDVVDLDPGETKSSEYTVLDHADARLLVACLDEEEGFAVNPIPPTDPVAPKVAAAH
ncbi:hypothetical protein AIOL_004747 [Candidatus Rhodobacter oscarellae]|uniref:Hedgehog/Intein (Hint) domain-containing protein n=1 Tax=Candidatus Rhodobacter oscarellae TaxID=1675527 RepID=A0A0J9EDG3_9RHOB|nr:Hint domain-containing protein [Candidatus Rhodobacter lobularis]KMW59764.1 hypothetical protein AIOL_004747 [Candidatus Rhodobacter lobularis]